MRLEYITCFNEYQNLYNCTEHCSKLYFQVSKMADTTYESSKDTDICHIHHKEILMWKYYNYVILWTTVIITFIIKLSLL